MAHVAAGRVMQFGLLQMELGIRETMKIADMVVVHMGQDHVLDRARVDAEQAERLHRATQERALAPFRYFGVKAGIDDDGPTPAPCHPDEIVHRHRPVMRIAADEMR